MYTPIMIYSDRDKATSAAVTLREHDKQARVVVEQIDEEPNFAKSLFIVQTPFPTREESMEVIDRVAARYPEILEHSIYCPQCDSVYVEYPDVPQASPTMKSIGKLFTMIDSIFGSKKEISFHCLECDHTWKKMAFNQRTKVKQEIESI